MNKKESIGIGTGSVSILAIFVVLCLTTLSALSLVSANADYKLAKKTADATQEYYAADAQAEEMLAKLVGYAAKGYAWEGEAMAEGFEIFQKGDITLVSYTVPINDGKNLYVEVELEVGPDGMTTGVWNRTVWQSQVIERPVEQTFNVMQ